MRPGVWVSVKKENLMTEIKELVEYLTKLIVDNTEDVEVGEKSGEKTMVFEIRVNKQDFGKILGKHGKNIQAIRTLVNAVSAKAGKRSTIEVIE
jgi:predicted RNA-binding protein YlqC (UPF0109 family)